MPRRPAPIEMPYSDDPLEQALYEEKRIAEANQPAKESGRRMSDKDMERATSEESGYKSDKDRETYLRSSETKMYKNGGMVRGCKSIQMTGKGFKGTF